jgi:hypothetical protein
VRGTCFVRATQSCSRRRKHASTLHSTTTTGNKRRQSQRLETSPTMTRAKAITRREVHGTDSKPTIPNRSITRERTTQHRRRRRSYRHFERRHNATQLFVHLSRAHVIVWSNVFDSEQIFQRERSLCATSEQRRYRSFSPCERRIRTMSMHCSAGSRSSAICRRASSSNAVRQHTHTHTHTHTHNTTHKSCFSAQVVGIVALYNWRFGKAN